MSRSAGRAGTAGARIRGIGVLLSLLVGIVAAPHAAAYGQLAPFEPPVLDLPHEAGSDDGSDGWPDEWPAAELDDLPAYVLVEAATGQILAAHRADERRAVASTVKILTGLTAVRRAGLEDEVVVGAEVEDIEGASVGLEPGDAWTVEELLDAVIARSGNDAAEALAVHVGGDAEDFLALMREDAAALGLTGVELVSVSGLDDANQLSARDLAVIARAALADEQLRPILGRWTVDLPSEGEVESRNLLLDSYPGATGLKTGFTIAAGNSLVGSAERDGRELVAVVLGAGEDPERFEAVAQLLDLGFDQLVLDTLDATLTYRVAGGELHLRVAPVEITSPGAHPAMLSLPVTARPPSTGVDAEVMTGTSVLGVVPATLDDGDAPTPVEGTAAIGRAAADGIYAALRASAGADLLR